MTAALFLLPYTVPAICCEFPSAHSFLQSAGDSWIRKYNQAASPAAPKSSFMFFLSPWKFQRLNKSAPKTFHELPTTAEITDWAQNVPSCAIWVSKNCTCWSAARVIHRHPVTADTLPARCSSWCPLKPLHMPRWPCGKGKKERSN